jgi:tetratricopeptide (TPR) repeat protein
VAPFSFSEKKSGAKNSRDKKNFRKDDKRKDNTRKDNTRKDEKRRTGPIKSRPIKERPPKITGPHERTRNFDRPWVNDEVTGEELDKKIIFQLESLTPGNAKSVARHMVSLINNLETNPKEAHQHGKEIVYRAGRLGVVREKAGIAALRAGEYKEALKDLRAAERITGSNELKPYIAQCEAALGNARKALEIAGSIKESALSKEGRVEMRIAAAKARLTLGQSAAAVVTLTCSELNEDSPAWSRRLRIAYLEALKAAGDQTNVEKFLQKYPQLAESSEGDVGQR